MGSLDLEDDELGFGLSDLNPVKHLKKVVKVAAGAGKLLKPIAGGLAIVYPPVGVPLAAGIMVADKANGAINSKDPKRKAAAVRVVAHTVKLAQSGHKGAANGLTLMVKRAAQTRAARQFRVDPRSGRVLRVKVAR